MTPGELLTDPGDHLLNPGRRTTRVWEIGRAHV